MPLSTEQAILHLRARGILAAAGAVRAQVVGGGVSSDVIRVETPQQAWMVKRPLEKFRVVQEWRVDPRRADVEARFARLVRQRLGPGIVADLVDHDPGTHTLVFEALPRNFAPWKAKLLAGRVDPHLAARAGELLARLHRLEPGTEFREAELFRQQRIDPYFVSLQRRHPSVEATMRDLGQRLQRGGTLVHGDFSPKNILTDGQRIVLVDHEVATLANPGFDVAFLLTHLLLKAFHGGDPDALSEACDDFLYAYGRNKGPAVRDEPLALCVSALLLARIDGKSPVEYLRGPQQERARVFAMRHVQRPPHVDELLAEAFAELKA